MRRGFTLVELLLAAALGLMLMVLGVVNLAGGRGGASSRGLAESVAEELRQARKLAVASGVPVGVGFPSGGGALACSQSLYRYQGEDRPQLTYVRSFSGDFAGSCLFLGGWGAGGAGSAQPALGANSDGFDLTTWPNPVSAADPVLVFLPTGAVISNSLGVVGGNFHLAACSGAVYSGAPPGATLSQVGKPFTLTLSPAGEVTLESGLVGSTGVTVASGPLAVPPCAAPPALALGANAAPGIDSLDVTPAPLAGFPAGTAEVQADGHLALRVMASDPDGDRLYCSWAGPGLFSSASEDRMEWDTSQVPPRWISTWEWRPPEGAPVPTTYDLTCTVRDQRGATVSGGGSGQLSVTTATVQRVIYNHQFGACQVYLDGTGESWLFNNVLSGIGELKISPDGTRMAYLQGDLNLMVRNCDGTGAVNLDNNCLWGSGLAWSPQGDYLCYVGGGFGPKHLSTMHPDGTSKTQFTNLPGMWEYEPHWSPDGSWIFYNASPAGVSTEEDIWVSRFRGGGPQNINLTPGRPGVQRLMSVARAGAVWRVCYTDEAFPANNVRIMEVDPATMTVTDPAFIIPNPTTAGLAWGGCEISPDGLKVVYPADPGGSAPRRIHCFEIDTGVDHDLGGQAYGAYWPIWTTDSLQVVYQGIPAGSQQLYAVPFAGGTTRQLTRNGAFDKGGCAKK